MLHPVRHADAFQRFGDALLPVRRFHPAIGERQLDVFKHVQVADEIETLEDKADLFIADAGALGVVQARHRLSVERVRAFGRRIEQTEDRKQRGLAAAGGTGDGNVFALFDVEVDARQRVRLDLVGVENFFDAFQFDEGIVLCHGSVWSFFVVR